MDAKECCDVVIVGCGIAGLSAGTRLLELDPSCRIAFIEARDRVGGRTETQHVKIPSPDENGDAATYPVDVGGQWLGSAHEEMISLVSSLDIDLSTSSRRLVECAYYSFPPLSLEAQNDVQRFNEFLGESVDK